MEKELKNYKDLIQSSTLDGVKATSNLPEIDKNVSKHKYGILSTLSVTAGILGLNPTNISANIITKPRINIENENTELYTKEKVVDNSLNYIDFLNPHKQNVYTLNEIHTNILSFACLKKDWDGFGAFPLEDKSSVNALSIVSMLNKEIISQISDLFPNPHGTLTIEWETSNGLLSLEIGNDSISFFKEHLGLETEYFNRLEISDYSIDILKTNITSIM